MFYFAVKFQIMTKIKFGTDGWRAIIAEKFTVENVARVAEATALWIKATNKNHAVVIGHDCRFAGELFAETTAKVILANGIKVHLAKGYVSTPMVSLGALKFNAGVGVIITASHNPPGYSGYKLKGGYGGPLLEEDIAEVEKYIPEKNPHDLDVIVLESFSEKGLLEYADLEKMYCEQLENNFDIDAIRKSKFRFAYDAMYGSGQNVIKRLLPEVNTMHCEHNPLFGGIPPEPIHRNLLEFSSFIKNAGNIDCGLVTDGDADRIGLYDSKGNFVDSHHILLLLIHYLHKYKGMTGKVCTGFSSSVKIAALCKYYGLELDVVKIGFKHICGIMLKEDVLVGGEESGGIAVKGHIPERDGIWNGLLIFEAMVKTGKTLQELIDEIYFITGAFAFERADLSIPEVLKQQIIADCKSNKHTSFGKYKVEKTETLDGFKYYFNESEWLMIRPSGTEPVLRTYAESYTKEDAFEILRSARETLGIN